MTAASAGSGSTTPEHIPWGRVLVPAALVGLLVAAAVSACGALVHGPAAGGSAGLAALGVLGALLLPLGAMAAGARVAPSAAPVIMLGSYGLLAVAGAMVLLAGAVPPWLRPWWVVAGVGLQLPLQLLLLGRGVAALRLTVQTDAPSGSTVAHPSTPTQEPRT